MFIRKAISISLICLVLLLSVSSFVLNKTRLNHHLIELIQTKVEKESPIKLKIGELEVNLLFFRVSLHNVSLSLSEETAKVEASLPELNLGLSALGVLFGEIRLSHLELNSPQVTLETFEGNDPFDGLPFNLESNFIDKLALSNVSFQHRFPAGKDQISYQLKNTDIHLSSKRKLWIKGVSDFKQIKIRKNDQDLVNKLSLKTSISLGKNILALENIFIKQASTFLNGSLEAGFIRNKKNKKIEALDLKTDLETHLDLSYFNQFLDKDEAEGSLLIKDKAELKINFIKNTVPFFESKGNLFSKKAKYDNFHLFDSTINYTLNTKKVLLNEVSLIKDTKLLAKAKGELSFSSTIPFLFDIQIKESTLQDIFDLFNVDNDSIDLTLKAPVVKLRGKALPLEIKITGPAKVENFSLLDLQDELKSPPKAFCDISIEININEQQLNFGNTTQGVCKILDDKNNATDEKKKTEAISSDLALSGEVLFKEKATDLRFITRKGDYKIASTFLPIKLEGKGSAFVRISSQDEKSKTFVKFSGNDVKLDEVPFLETEGSMSLKGDTLFIDKLLTYKEEGKLFTKGSINFKDNVFSLEGSSSGLNKKAIHSIREHFFSDFPLTGQAKDLKYKIKGPLEKPLSARGEIHATMQEVFWDEEKIFDELETRLTRTHDRIHIRSCKGSLGSYLINCEGRLSQKSKNGFTNEILENFDIQKKDSFLVNYTLIENLQEGRRGTYLPFLDQFFLSRGLSLSHFSKGTFHGTPQNPKLDISGSINDITYDDELSFSNINYTINLDKKNFEAYLQQDGRSLFGSFISSPQKKGHPFKISLKLDQFDLRFLFPSLFYLDPRNFSYLTSDISLSGNIAPSAKIEKASWKLNSFNSNYFYEASDDKEYLEFSLKKPYFFHLSSTPSQKPSQKIQLKSNHFDLELDGIESILQEDGRLDMKGSLDLAILGKLVPNILYSQGNAFLQGHLALKGQSLDYNFNFKNKLLDQNNKVLEPAAVMIVGLEPQLEKILFDIDYKDSSFHINQLFAEKGEGSLSVSGDFTYNEKGTESSLLTAELNRANFTIKTPYLKEIDSLLTGKIFLTGKKAPYRVYGDIKIDQLSSSMSYNFTQEAIRSLQKRQLTQSLSQVTQDAFVDFNINLTSDKTITINNKDLNLTASAKIKLLGNNKEIGLFGLIRTDEGTFRYKKDFEIERCFVYFNEKDSLDPSLDIKANSYIDGYKVSLNVLGKASNPLADFDITPKISRDDNQPISNLQIMYLISQGTLPKAAEDSNSSSNFYNDKKLLASINYARELLPLGIINDFIGSDIIKIRLEFNDFIGNNSIFGVSANFNIINELDAKIQANFNEISRAFFSLEYRFNPQIKALLDVKINGDQIKTQNQRESFNLKFNFPF